MNITFELSDLLCGAGAGLITGAILALVLIIMVIGDWMNPGSASLKPVLITLGASTFVGAILGAFGLPWWGVVLSIFGVVLLYEGLQELAAKLRK